MLQRQQRSGTLRQRRRKGESTRPHTAVQRQTRIGSKTTSRVRRPRRTNGTISWIMGWSIEAEVEWDPGGGMRLLLSLDFAAQHRASCHLQGRLAGARHRGLGTQGPVVV